MTFCPGCGARAGGVDGISAIGHKIRNLCAYARTFVILFRPLRIDAQNLSLCLRQRHPRKMQLRIRLAHTQLPPLRTLEPCPGGVGALPNRRLAELLGSGRGAPAALQLSSPPASGRKTSASAFGHDIREKIGIGSTQRFADVVDLEAELCPAKSGSIAEPQAGPFARTPKEVEHVRNPYVLPFTRFKGGVKKNCRLMC